MKKKEEGEGGVTIPLSFSLPFAAARGGGEGSEWVREGKDRRGEEGGNMKYQDEGRKHGRRNLKAYPDSSRKAL